MEREIVRLATTEGLRRQTGQWRTAAERIALVPTMGALHEGHLSLVRLARQRARRVIVSIFVNPTQFGAGEDLDAYPRQMEADINKLAVVGADAVFAPSAGEIYPKGFATTVCVSGVSEDLCGAARPGHFDGVATIVAKLLLMAAPDIAVFGEKDFQQLLVIRRMTLDLNIPVDIVGAPIVREADGLAMSSRNAYLTGQQRAVAPRLHEVLVETAEALKLGAPVAETLQTAREELAEAGLQPEYVELRHGESLAPLARLDGAPARLLVAARLGGARLGGARIIDNMAVIG